MEKINFLIKILMLIIIKSGYMPYIWNLHIATIIMHAAIYNPTEAFYSDQCY